MLPEIPIALEHFPTKVEAARYLSAVLSILSRKKSPLTRDLWTWLALYYFDSVCVRHQGKLNVKNGYYHVFAPRKMRQFYRHLRRLAPLQHRLILSTRLQSLEKVISEVAMRLYITRIPAVFEVLSRLYWDDKRKRHRRGITDTKVHAGDLSHRFPMQIRQLEKTFDLMSLNPDQLLELLG